MGHGLVHIYYRCADCVIQKCLLAVLSSCHIFRIRQKTICIHLHFKDGETMKNVLQQYSGLVLSWNTL